MIRFLSVLALVLVAGAAQAGRIPSQKVPSSRESGVRGDITVPYLTNGRTTLGVADGVAPALYARPTVNDPQNKGVLPVFNLIYYGSKLSANSLNNGPVPRQANQLRPTR